MGEPGVKGEKGKPMNIKEIIGTNLTVITVKVGYFVFSIAILKLTISRLRNT